MYLIATSAHKNTSETDKLPKVMHTVSYTKPDGKHGKTQMMAKDPQDAIRRVNRMTVNDLRLV